MAQAIQVHACRLHTRLAQREFSRGKGRPTVATAASRLHEEVGQALRSEEEDEEEEEVASPRRREASSR